MRWQEIDVTNKTIQTIINGETHESGGLKATFFVRSLYENPSSLSFDRFSEPFRSVGPPCSLSKLSSTVGKLDIQAAITKISSGISLSPFREYFAQN